MVLPGIEQHFVDGIYDTEILRDALRRQAIAVAQQQDERTSNSHYSDLLKALLDRLNSKAHRVHRPSDTTPMIGSELSRVCRLRTNANIPTKSAAHTADHSKTHSLSRH